MRAVRELPPAPCRGVGDPALSRGSDKCLFCVSHADLRRRPSASDGQSLESRRFGVLGSLEALHRPFRQFTVGEYGSRTARAHYHLLLFSDDPDFLPPSRRLDSKLYSNDLVDEKWGKGFAPIGNVEWDSIGYVARYSLKQQQRKMVYFPGAPVPEYSAQSRRPAIGRTFFDRYWEQIYAQDQVVVRGKSRRPPKRYDQWLAEHKDADLWLKIQAAREEQQRPDYTMRELQGVKLNMEAARKRWAAGRKKV